MYIDDGFFRGPKFNHLPDKVQQLAVTALHSFDWGVADSNANRSIDYSAIRGMVGYALETVGDGPIDHAWMIVALWKLGEVKEVIEARWPYQVMRHEGRLWSRDPLARVFAALAFWQVQLVAESMGDQDRIACLDHSATAGLLLYFAGISETDGNESINVADVRQRAPKARWDKDPTQFLKSAIKAEWKAWQGDRGKYKYPRDFRREMLVRFPNCVDGTLKNWMSEWGRENE